MFNKLLGLLLISGIALGACSSSKSVYLEEGILKNSIKDPFYVIPINNSWVQDAGPSGLPSQLQRIFEDGIGPAISSATPVPFETADQMNVQFNGNFRTAKLPTDRGELEIYKASDDLLSTLENRYVLFLENYSFEVKVNQGSGGSYAGMDNENTRTITFTSEFYIWDNDQKKAISWGTIKEDSIIRETPKAADYRELLGKSAARLLKESPISVYP